MIAFLNAMVIGAVFALVVSALIGHSGIIDDTTGGISHVRHFVVEGFAFYWSWILFLAGTGLARIILLVLE